MTNFDKRDALEDREHRKHMLKMLGIRVREVRESLLMSQIQLGKKCGLDRTYLSGVENGRRNASFLSLCSICIALDVSFGQLLDTVKSDIQSDCSSP